MKAPLPEILHAATNVVEAQIALDAAEQDGTDAKRYRDNLGSTVYRLRWLIERDRRDIAKRLREADQHALQAVKRG